MKPFNQSNNIVAQKYQIINTLGEGGSGITYLAQDLHKNQIVALKALSLHRMTDWKAMELFEREAKILAQLNHPSIPDYLEYFDADTDGEKHFYIAQQLAPGKSLAKLVEENWRTNEQQLKDIAKQILEILIYLHSLTPPVTHRDIKPQNIIYDNKKVFLVDFGAVQDTYYSTFMRGSTVVGTYGYMAPEQFQGKAVPATDLYGLGATLLFLLTHRSPADFPTDGLKIDFRSQIKVSDDFADWLDKMLEPDLEERFSSAKVALEVLQGKRKIILGKPKPMLLKAAIAMGITIALGTFIFNNYKWAILVPLGFKPPQTICKNASQITNFVNLGGNPNYKFIEYGTGSYKLEERSLLLCAMNANSQQLVDFLIAKGANINNTLPYVNSVDWAKFLISKGADVNTQDLFNRTPLHHAVANQNKSMIELLLSHQADINTKDKFGNTPLYLVFQELNQNQRYSIDTLEKNQGNDNKDTLALVKFIVNKKAEIKVSNSAGYTPLHFAAKENNLDLIKYFLEQGAEIDKRNTIDGKTPLMLAIEENSNFTLLELLIAKGADINKRDHFGKTPLMIAAKESNSPNLIEFLIEKGANPTLRDNNGQTASRIARNNNNDEVGLTLSIQEAHFELRKEYKYLP